MAASRHSEADVGTGWDHGSMTAVSFLQPLILALLLTPAPGTSKAIAQTMPGELFLPPTRVFPLIAPKATGFNLGPAPLATGFFHPPLNPLLDPLDTVAPAAVYGDAGFSPARSLPWNEVLTRQAILERANRYFAGMTTLVADFRQVSGGRELTGKLYLHQPGRLRFAFDAPATVDVVADGKTVTIRDTRLGTQVSYGINQTPLKFLLGDGLTLGKDITVTGTTTRDEQVEVTLRDRSALGGASRIVLTFDPAVRDLQQWRIVDPQGDETVVMLRNARRGEPIDPAVFEKPDARTR
jgi:outer membrane lipoprotein-sorting protein